LREQLLYLHYVGVAIGLKLGEPNKLIADEEGVLMMF